MSPVAYSPTSGAAFLSTARATRRPQSSRTNARRAEALSSARLANAVPGSSCPCNGPRSANSCSSNWSPVPRGKVPNTHCEGEKPPLRLRLFLVLTDSAIAIFVVKTLDSVLGNHPFQHCLKQSSVSLDSSDLLRALHPCLADQTPWWASVRAKTPRLWTQRSQLKVCGQPAQPTHKLTKLSKHSRLDGEPCPCRSSTTC